MTGKPQIGLTERDRDVIHEVSRFGAMTRDQLMRLRLFTSKTRANDRLQKLVRAGVLASRRQALMAGGPRLVYLPGPALAEAKATRLRYAHCSDLFLEHQLGLVDIRLAFEHHTVVAHWRTDKELQLQGLGTVPDSYVECEIEGLAVCCFLEYDRGTETLGRVERKVDAYRQFALSGTFERTFGRRFFRLLIVTDADRRLETLSKTVARVTDKMVRLTTLPLLVAQGPARSIWRRPGQSRFESLTGA